VEPTRGVDRRDVGLILMRWQVGFDNEMHNGCSVGGNIHLSCISTGSEGARCVMSGAVVEMGGFTSSFPDDDGTAGAFRTSRSCSAMYTHSASCRLGGFDGASK
jgi:hypothetical protein